MDTIEEAPSPQQEKSNPADIDEFLPKLDKNFSYLQKCEHTCRTVRGLLLIGGIAIFICFCYYLLAPKQYRIQCVFPYDIYNGTNNDTVGSNKSQLITQPSCEIIYKGLLGWRYCQVFPFCYSKPARQVDPRQYFRQDVDLSFSDETLTFFVADYRGNRYATFIHDFISEESVFMDTNGYCYIWPLDKENIIDVDEFLYFSTELNKITKNFKPFTKRAVKQLWILNYYRYFEIFSETISKACQKRIFFLTQFRKEDINGTEIKSEVGDFIEFNGIDFNEYDIINYDKVVGLEKSGEVYELESYFNDCDVKMY